MLQSIKKTLQVNVNEFWQCAVVTLGTGALGVGLLFLIMLLAKPDTYIYLGSFVAALIAIMLYLLLGIFGFMSDFNLAVSLGVTRKRFAVGYLLRCLLTSALITGIMALFYLLESNLYAKVFKDAVLEMDFAEGVTVKIFLVIMFVIPVIRFAVGAFITRFQKVGFWVLWAVWMIGCLGGSRLVHRIRLLQNDTGVMGQVIRSVQAFVKQSPQAVLAVLGAGVLILFIGLGWLFIRRQAVKNA